MRGCLWANLRHIHLKIISIVFAKTGNIFRNLPITYLYKFIMVNSVAQLQLVKDVQQAERKHVASQPAAAKLRELPTLRPFDAASLGKMVQQVGLPRLVSTGAVKVVVDVASLGEPPPLPQLVRTTATPPTAPGQRTAGSTPAALQSKPAGLSTPADPGGVRQRSTAEQARIEHAAARGAAAGQTYSVGVGELGAARWSSQIGVARVGELLYVKAGMAQGLTREQATDYAQRAKPQPHVFGEGGRLRPMTASDLDNRAIMARNTNERGSYRAVVPGEVLAQMRAYKQHGAAGVQQAEPTAVAAGSTIVLTRPATVPGAELARKVVEAPMPGEKFCHTNCASCHHR